MNRALLRGAAAFLWTLAPSAFALNPSLDISQYGHTAWTIRDGFFKGRIYSIAQTSDGYLMLGTEFGLTRFDGVRNVDWVPPAGQRLPSSNIRSLLAARDGTLWIGTLEGLASWKDGTLTQFPEVAGQHVYTLIEDRNGTIWAGTFALPTASLCEIRGGKAKCHGQEGALGHWVESIYEDHAGNVWAGAETGLWRWSPGPPQRYTLPHAIDTDHGVMEDENRSGMLLIADRLWRFQDGKIAEYSPPGVRWPFNPICMLRDRDGALWLGTLERGLLHLYHGRTDLFSPRDGLSGEHVRCVFEDREGNIWVATADGLDRFRALTADSVTARQGLSAPSAMSVLVDHAGAVWAGTSDGLNQWKDGRITVYRAPGSARRALFRDRQAVEGRVREIRDPGLADDEVGSLYEDDAGRIWVSTFGGISRFENGRFTRVRSVPGGWVNGFSGDGKGGLWIAYQDRGLYHVAQEQIVDRFPWATLGRGVASSMTLDTVRKGLWLGFFKGGVVYWEGNRVSAAYGASEGVGAGRVMGLRVDTEGVLWAATEGGLSRIQDGRVTTLTRANGLGCDAVHWTVEDRGAFFWLYTPCGMVRAGRPELERWAAQPSRTIESTVFGPSDGVRLMALLAGNTPRVSQSAAGQFWFAHLDGISVIDPHALPVNRQEPPVEIEQITADRKVYWQRSPGESSRRPEVRPLPPLSRDVVIDYTALSLVAPEKIQFRYRLEGYDSHWQDAGNRRQASYNTLPPRPYRFRVIASNNSGVWNEAGASVEFSIAPAYYQTDWFRAGGAVVFLAALWGLYRLRIYQIGREFHAQLDGRVDERLRVARDLHDTMLQTFQAASIQMQAAFNQLSSRPEAAAATLQEAIDTSEMAIAEGREAIQDMRLSTIDTNNLAGALRAEGNQLAAHASITFAVKVRGTSRDIHPILRDDVYRIAVEAIRNAFKHAEAQAIEAEIGYEDSLTLRIRDNGKGVDPAILDEGRSGHYGIPGMRERARHIGGTLEVWTGAGAGTEIQLSIPAEIAFGKPGSGSLLRRFRPKSKSADRGT